MKRRNVFVPFILSVFGASVSASYSTSIPIQEVEVNADAPLNNIDDYLNKLSEQEEKGKRVLQSFSKAKTTALIKMPSRELRTILKDPSLAKTNDKDKLCIFEAAKKANLSPLFLVTGGRYETNFGKVKSKDKNKYGLYALDKQTIEGVANKYALGKVEVSNLENACYASYFYALTIKDWLKMPSKHLKEYEANYEKTREMSLEIISKSTFP